MRNLKNNYQIVLAFVATVVLLYWRFELAMVRVFDEDEFTHMFRAYLISQGKIPYKDFGYFYSPIFATLFSPFFFFFKEQTAVVFLSRSLEFVIFLAIIYVVWLIGKALSGLKIASLTAFLLAFFPLALDKTIEIRPDNLAILFWIASFLFLLWAEKKGNEKLIFLAGLSLGLSVSTIIKMVFVYPGLLVYLVWSYKNSCQRLFKNLVFFHLGIFLPLAVLMFVFLLLGVLPEAIYSIFLMPIEASQTYGRKYFVPLFPFFPNDAFYGVGGKSLPWFLSNLVFLLGIIGMFKSRLRAFFLSSFASFGIAIFWVYNLTLVQYYLPLLVLAVLGAAEFMGFIGDWIVKKLKPLFALYWISVLSFLSLGFWQSAKAHLHWRNDSQIASLRKMIVISQPQDHFFDMTGYHLFRPSGYFLCCEFFADWSNKLSQRLPLFQDEIKRTQTKFIFQTLRLGRLSIEDSKFLRDNYFPSGVEKILVVGKRLTFSNGVETQFEMIASGDYELEMEGKGIVMIDGQEVGGKKIYLTHGKHTAIATGVKELFLAYVF